MHIYSQAQNNTITPILYKLRLAKSQVWWHMPTLKQAGGGGKGHPQLHNELDPA